MAKKMQFADVACVLLAAGRSARFGERCKLSTPFRGLRLGDHAVGLFAGLPFAEHLIVQRPGSFVADDQRFQAVFVSDAKAGMAHSIVCGMNALREPRAVMIALADMPLVSAAHIAALVDAFDGEDTDCIIASAADGRRMPPALFGRGHFEMLRQLSGDAGARDLIASAQMVAGDPAMLTDIDTPETLASLDPP